MNLFQRILSNLSFFIIVMLLFLLFFQDKVSLPPALQSVGRMHPLLLHLPIGLLVISFVLWIANKGIDNSSFRNLFILVLQIAAFTASLTALMGFFLSRESGYDSAALQTHKILGVAIAILSYLLLILYQYFPGKRALFGISITASLLVVIAGSHFGATLTHGEGFVWQPLKSDDQVEDVKITDSSSLFSAAIVPILKSKCFSCHNEKKAKGKLVMTSEEKLLQGGKNGPIWKSGDALNSHIIQNINLPEDEKKHMPPKGKPQLTQQESDLLFAWIQAGADMQKPLKDFAEDDTVRILASTLIRLPGNETEKLYPFASAPPSVIQKLSGPFCAVFPLSQYSPALQADFFVREKFDRKNLEALLKVKEQLVVLNLGNMPVEDGDMKTISQFSNLEKLILNHSLVTNAGLAEMQKLKKLQSVSLAGTKIDASAASALAQLDSLKEVFVWNTKISPGELSALQNGNKRIRFHIGYVPDEKEILTLTPPTVKNEEFILSDNEKIILKHQVPGVDIRFTSDGSEPDSTSSPVYKDPVAANGYTVIRARATRPGWFSSDISSFTFFEKGISPAKTELINQPNEKYKGEGASTLVDGKKGTADNFNDPAWLGYREQPFAAWFSFDTAPKINSISISYNENIPSYLLPPAEVQVWAGDDVNKLKLVKKVSPALPTKDEKDVVRIEAIRIDIPGSNYKCYKIIAKNVSKLPAWHPGKGDKAWIFIDEIFFN